MGQTKTQHKISALTSPIILIPQIKFPNKSFKPKRLYKKVKNLYQLQAFKVLATSFLVN